MSDSPEPRNDDTGSLGFIIFTVALLTMRQREAVQKLHGDERPAIFFSNVVDGADVRVVQSGSCFSLPAKALGPGGPGPSLPAGT
jgi:hypothetical protein